MAKAINGSVGLGGMNQPTDVMVVQYLLNCVPVHQGGPPLELVIDGIAGPKTTQAIWQFQSVHLGFADSRVDPYGQTLRELNKFDPYPQEPFNPVGEKWGQKTSPWFKSQKGYGGKTQGGSTAGKGAGKGWTPGGGGKTSG